MSQWDHDSHEPFYEYYEQASQSEETRQRFRAIQDCVLRVMDQRWHSRGSLRVADIGCGAGTQSMIWAELGHRVHALDINEPLLRLARRRAAEAGVDIEFKLGSSTAIPWSDNSMDVCLAVELLEHVREWKTSLHEFARILRPGGVLLLTTTNKLCPVQQEFNLPIYSWYPSFVKHYFVRLATTTRPEIANYAKYPAVNWFSFYGLRTLLAELGFYSMDRFDILDVSTKGKLARSVLQIIRAISLCRFLAHIVTPSTILVAVKGGSPR